MPDHDRNDPDHGGVFRRGSPRERRQLQADLTMALYLYRFASRQLVAKLTSMQVVVPTEIAEALMLVEQWVGELLPARPDS
jgi:hypothetical protein